ncbi:hypothetical protein SGCOL_008240 [Colletotrichum sp. CLE4]
MNLVNQVEYSSETKVASIGAGHFGVTGRTSTVGVTGFLTGGGNNFFGADVGLGCDNVVNFEVVLASGETVNANRETHSDLHQAFKDGSSNFGIVTRVDIQRIDVVNIWGGQVVYPLNTTEQHIAAYVKWVDNIPNYTKGSAVAFWAYTPTAGTVVSADLHDTSDSEWAPAYKEFQTIGPQIANTFRHDSHLNMTVELEEPMGYRQIWITLTGKNDARFIHADFLNYITFQAMPTLLFKHSTERGGNVVGMEREAEDAILFQMQHMVRADSAEKKARKQHVAMRQELKDFYISEGVNVEWEYLGYANGSQDPLSTYGQENIQFLEKVAT